MYRFPNSIQALEHEAEKKRILSMSINTRIGRKYDYFKNLVVPNGCYYIVRLDGNCFSSFTENMEHPFDMMFYDIMKRSGMHLMEEIPDIYMVHTHSDEMSLFFKKESDWFNRRVEKITSITASIMSAYFSMNINREAHFDSRVIVCPTLDEVEEYEKDRRLNAFRGCVNSYVYYKLADKHGKKEATERLSNIDIKPRQELLFQEFGININNVPLWQKVGAVLKWEQYEREGFNPQTKQTVPAIRRRITVIE